MELMSQIRPEESVAIVESFGFMSAARLAQMLGQETRVRIIAISPMNASGNITTIFGGALAEVQYALQVARSQNMVQDFTFFARPNLETIEMLMRSVMVGASQQAPQKRVVRREESLPLFEQEVYRSGVSAMSTNGSGANSVGGFAQPMHQQPVYPSQQQYQPTQSFDPGNVYHPAPSAPAWQAPAAPQENYRMATSESTSVSHAPQPMTSQPMTSQPMTSQPMTSQPMTSQPVAAQPRTMQEPAPAVYAKPAAPRRAASPMPNKAVTTKATPVTMEAPKPAKANGAAPHSGTFSAKPLSELEGYNVHDLRRYTRSIPNFPIQGREISRANRGELLQLIKTNEERQQTAQAQASYSGRAVIDGDLGVPN